MLGPLSFGERTALRIRAALLCAMYLLLTYLFPVLPTLAGPSQDGASDNVESDVGRSWTGAIVFVPGDPAPKTTAEIPTGRRLPVVVYMHGCAGIDRRNDLPWAQYIAKLGFIVVLPDRFARAYREPSCHPHRNPVVHQMRREEIAYALAQVRASAWVDDLNVFAMGFSEGADAIAESRLPGLRGAILSSWTCGRVTGISLPAGVPVLSVRWDQTSPWRWWDSAETGCADKFKGRDGFRDVLLHGKGHATYGEPAARDAVGRFLRDNLAPAH